MIRAYRATYIKFDDEETKRTDSFLAIEIINRKNNLQQVIIMNKNHLVLAAQFNHMTEIKGYHHFKKENAPISSFGIGGLSQLNTKSAEGMLEGLAKQTGMNYGHLATEFGKGLLEAVNDYTAFVEI